MFNRIESGNLLNALHEMCKSVEGGHMCTGCRKTFGRPYDFKRHWQVGVPCQLCNTYVARSDLNKWGSFLKHYKTVHSYPSNDIQEKNLEAYFKNTSNRNGKAYVPRMCMLKDRHSIAMRYVRRIQSQVARPPSAAGPTSEGPYGTQSSVSVDRMPQPDSSYGYDPHGAISPQALHSLSQTPVPPPALDNMDELLSDMLHDQNIGEFDESATSGVSLSFGTPADLEREVGRRGVELSELYQQLWFHKKQLWFHEKAIRDITASIAEKVRATYRLTESSSPGSQESFRNIVTNPTELL